MCRILMCNRKGFNKIEREIGMLNELNHLEKECGGYGNGYILINNNRIVEIKKGITLTNHHIMKRCEEVDFDWFIYHTRVPSVGEKSNKNCHPFFNDDLSFALVMNGTESGSISDIADNLGVTDTEVVFNLIDKMGCNLALLDEMNSRYMGFYDGNVFLKNTNFQGLQYVSKKGAICIASSFVKGYEKGKTLKEGLWFEGDTLQESVKRDYRAFNTGRYKWFEEDYSSEYEAYNELQYGIGYYDREQFREELKKCQNDIDIGYRKDKAEGKLNIV